MPKRPVLLAVLCGVVATCVIGLVGDALHFDQACVIVASVAGGLVVMLAAAALLDTLQRR